MLPLVTTANTIFCDANSSIQFPYTINIKEIIIIHTGGGDAQNKKCSGEDRSPLLLVPMGGCIVAIDVVGALSTAVKTWLRTGTEGGFFSSAIPIGHQSITTNGS